MSSYCESLSDSVARITDVIYFSYVTSGTDVTDVTNIAGQSAM